MLMRKHSLLWRSDSTTNTMLIGGDYHNESKIPLSFLLESNNPFFYNFTDLPLSRPLKKLYLHNLADSYPENNVTTLGSSFWTNSEPPEYSGYKPPEYVLNEVNPGHLGLVDLHLSPSAGNSNFLISLKPRNTIWRYWLVDKAEASIEHLEVREKYNNIPLQFYTGETRILANGKPAFPLIIQNEHASPDPGQACSERHTLRPVLHLTVKQGGEMPQKIILDLPTPDYRQINTESTDSGLQLFSDMYVNFFKPNFF